MTDMIVGGINFGGSTLAAYTAQTTATSPTITFATPGDLSVAYTTQSLKYSLIGGMYYISFAVDFTPTYTTASGALRIEGLPATIGAVYGAIPVTAITSTLTFPAGVTAIYAYPPNATYLTIIGLGSATANVTFTTTQFVSGVAYRLYGAGMFLI